MGDGDAKTREILLELNQILHKTSFYPCRHFFLAVLKSLGACFSAAFINVIILYFSGKDVHERTTGLADDYNGSISPYAPEDGLILLRQVDPAQDDRECCAGWWKLDASTIVWSSPSVTPS